MDIAANIARVRSVISAKASGRENEITIVAVTKTRPPEDINKLMDCGIFDIGENRVQEWFSKKDEIQQGYRMHHIGRLQSNKVKFLMGHVSLIHSVDRLSLLEEISRRSTGNVDILLQVNTAREEQKAGLLVEELPKVFDNAMAASGVTLRGFMCIAPLDGGREAAGEAFSQAKTLFDKYQKIASDRSFTTLSMGMSGDYDIALECGANMIRIGSSLFI